jgi:hypothetical protein
MFRLYVSKLVLQGIWGGYLSNTQLETIQGILPNTSFINWYWIDFFGIANPSNKMP